MFTGLVDAIGVLERVTESPAGRELRILASYEGVVPGESIAVNGACLTVRAAGPGWFEVAAVVTTRDRTTIGAWTAGRRVNLERSLKLGDRMGGHIVQGHVDGVGTVTRIVRRDDALLLDVDVPREIFQLLVPHGAITVDGISLTVNDIPNPGVMQLSIIEYTERLTAVSDLTVGSDVHLEGDVIGKYVRQLLEPYRPR